MFGLEVCDANTKRAMSAVGGAVMAYTGTDRMFAPTLGPAVHHALAGVGVHALCRGPAIVAETQELGIALIAGYIGGMAAKMLR